MNKRKYITTTLPYANSKPHIGHAFEFIIGDALSRYFKYNGYDVFFNIGLDEHGLKIQQAAEKKKITPQEYVDELLYDWEDFIEKFKIDSWDSFYRTSDVEHLTKVQNFWKDAVDNNDIYKKKYKGTYCVGCESFKLEKDLEDGSCPDHPTTELQEVEEENYFFKLSKYRKKLHSWAYQATKFIEPESKRTEFLSFIDTIEDISVSRIRETVSWGVPVPGDDKQIIYVWFDALLNYIYAVDYNSVEPGNPLFDEFWNDAEVVQICGPDNLKFQAVIFQGLLVSVKVKNSDKLLVHGTILDKDGRKMSKTLGNVVDPIDQVNKYGIDAVRYYALAGLSTYGNSSWDEERLVELYNSHLADDYGNLVVRVVVLAGKALEKFQDDSSVELDYNCVEGDDFIKWFDLSLKVVKSLWDDYKISEALALTNKLVKNLNKKITDEEPWKDLKKGWTTILELHYAISKVNELYYPVIPEKAGKVRLALRECKKVILFPKINIEEVV